MPQQKLVAIDFGSSGIKCIIFSLSGKAIVQRFTPIQYLDSKGLNGIGKEFDAPPTWSRIGKMIRDCLSDLKASSKDIIATSVTSQRLGAVFLDEKGKVIYAGPNLDARGVFVQDSVISQLKESCPPTGCWPPLLYSLCRLIWYKIQRPELYARIRHVLSISDWIVFQLTGEVTTDPSQASNTQFLDIQKSKWSPEILEMADISSELLPPINEPGSYVGTVTAKASKETGLSHNTVVGLGGADTQCAMLGSAITKPFEVCVVAGNTAPIQLLTDKPIIDKEHKLWTGRYLLPNHWVVEANTGKTGAVLSWFAKNIVNPLWANIDDSQNAYARIEQLATKSEVGASDTFALLGPTIMDASDMTTVRPSLFIFPPPASLLVNPITLNDLARALYENICFAIRSNLELIQEQAKITFDHCSVAGGLTRSHFWLQMLANVTGYEIHRGQEVEASSLGAAICAATAGEFYDSILDAIGNMVNMQPIITPNPKIQQKYETYFTRWQTLYKQSANL